MTLIEWIKSLFCKKVVVLDTPSTVNAEIRKERDRFVLCDDDYQNVADYLKVDLACVKAVQEVESSGKAFLTEGYVVNGKKYDRVPQILFEGHIFWKQLKNKGLNPSEILLDKPSLNSVLYQKWVKSYYLGGIKEYSRLDLACSVDVESALNSTSWGLFQIMGFNHKLCGYDNVKDYVDGMCQSAYNQLEAFASFAKSNKLDTYLRNKDWAGFAYRYNGSGYKQNKYDEKLKKAYEKFNMEM